MKIFSAGFLIIVTFLALCGHTEPKSSIDKKTFDTSEVSSIAILKVTGPPDTIKCVWKYLTEEQIKSFADKWNSASDKELRKYLPTYKIAVYFKNDSTRNFRVNGQYIKEDNDWCFDFKDKDYFEKLYSDATLKGNR